MHLMFLIFYQVLSDLACCFFTLADGKIDQMERKQEEQQKATGNVMCSIHPVLLLDMIILVLRR